MLKRKKVMIQTQGLGEYLGKVQNLMHDKGARCVGVLPRVMYEGDTEEKVHFEATFEATEDKADKILRNKKLNKYCTSMTTLQE